LTRRASAVLRKTQNQQEVTMKGNTKGSSAWNWAKTAALGLGILALVFGLTLAGCDDPNSSSGGSGGGGSGGGKTLTGAIKITNSSGTELTTANAGDGLYAFYSGDEDVSYQWNKNGTAIEGKTSSMYDPEEAGRHTVTVSAEGYQSKTSAEVVVDKPPVNWRLVTNSGLSTSSSINGVAYGGASGEEKWVAVGRAQIAYSTNGTSWMAATTTDSGFNNFIYGVAYGNNRWVAVGYDGKIATSDDGISWTAVDTANSGDFNSAIKGVAYGGVSGQEKWVAVGGSRIATSTDGTSWTAVDDENIIPFYQKSINGVAYGNGKWVAGGPSGAYDGKMAYYADGTLWTNLDNALIHTNGVAHGGGKWVAVGNNGKMAYCED
jgi:hypothetical protein